MGEVTVVYVKPQLVAGPIREVYLNDPREVGLEEALTEIYVPIK